MPNFIDEIKNYTPTCEQEEADKKLFLDAIEKFDNVLVRENKLCHFCSSAFIINKEHTKVLCIYHNIYNSWGWVGGHADGDDDFQYVALKEMREETGLENAKILCGGMASLDTICVHNHIKRGKFVNSHLHLNCTYLLEADEKDAIRILPDENSAIAWLTFDELLQKATEEHMLPIYKKFIKRIKENNL